MIRAYEKKDYDAVMQLWHEAFGDSKEDIACCLAHLAKHLIVLEADKTVQAMFMLMPITAAEKQGYYIYAVATAKCARGNGHATTLLDYAKARMADEKKDFLVLVPASASLFDFYKARGFTSGSPVSTLFSTSKTSNPEASIRRISPRAMHAKRRAYFKNLPFAQWDISTLSVIDTLYGKCFYEINLAEGNAFCMAYESGGKLKIAELCTSGISPMLAMQALCRHFGLSEAEAVIPDSDGKPFAMFYPAEYTECYFNLALN